MIGISLFLIFAIVFRKAISWPTAILLVWIAYYYLKIIRQRMNEPPRTLQYYLGGLDNSERTRLQGPGTITYYLKFEFNWRAIESELLKKVDGWTRLPEELCQALTVKCSVDLITGFAIRRAYRTRFGSEKEEVFELESDELKVKIPVGSIKKRKDEIATTTYDTLKIQTVDGDLMVGFVIHALFRHLDYDEAIAIFPLRKILDECLKMECLYKNAALARSLNINDLYTHQYRIKSKYNPEDNPSKDGWHKFTNKYVNLLLRYETHESVFSDVEDFSETETDKFSEYYYGTQPLDKGFEELQNLLRNIYADRLLAPFYRPGHLSLEQKENVRTQLDAWHNRAHNLDRDLELLIDKLTNLQLTKSALSIAENSFLPNIVINMFSFPLFKSDIQLKFLSTSWITDSKKLPVLSINHVGYNKIEITREEIKHSLWLQTRSDFEYKFKITHGETSVCEILIPMNYGEDIEKPLGHSYSTLTKYGKVLAIESGVWLSILLKTYIMAANAKELQQLERMLV